jgi:lipopolysaccharide/colanic/teichoic acid biosynthesis glycosyltransferase
MMKRLFDICFSSACLFVLLPIMLIISIWVAMDSRGGVFFRQTRVGRDGVHFGLWKFRTMKPQSESAGQLTVGSNDMRITVAGKILRRYKVDELPQLWNVVCGDMSMVGPRPEVPKYVAMYTLEQSKVLSIRPGITDKASLIYFEENDLLAQSKNPEETYIQSIMPEKLKLNLMYMEEQSFLSDLKIIGNTIKRMFS